MLHEFVEGRQLVYRVNPQKGGSLERVSDMYAPDFFKEQDGTSADSTKAADSPVSPTAPRGSKGASRRRLRQRRLQVALQHLFLPAGYPNSVTDDLLAFALWDAAQVLANNVMATLSTRAVLLGVGVGESSANLTSSTFSWMMRDGTWLVGSIVFASLISQDLEFRAKTWRLVADFTNDMASLLELCAPWLPGGQLTFRLVVVLASVIKALVGVCGGGTRASFTQHFALQNNAADVAAKAGTRGNVGGLVGLALGMAVAYIVPATSTPLNLVVFVLCTSFHLYANYKGVRGVQLRRLNAPRLEWCLDQFCVHKERVLIAQKKDAEASTSSTSTGGSRRSAAPVLDISPRRANAEEPLFILPALRAVPPPHSGVYEGVYRLLRRYVFPPTLTLRFHCGSSLAHVLAVQNDLTTKRKQALVQQVAESLSVRGVALLVDDAAMAYYVILPEYYTAEGVPQSWVRYKRQYEASKKDTKHSHNQRKARAEATTDGNDHTAAEEEDAEVLAEMERLRKERVIIPPYILPLAYRELWAFFYAYMHYRAARYRREHALPHPNAVLSSDKASPSLTCQRVHLITRLRADGLLAEGEEGEGPHGNSGGENGDEDHSSVTAPMEPITPELFDEITSPASATTPKAKGFPSKGAAATAVETVVNTAIAHHDGLYPVFLDFVRGLRKSGWELDRLLIDNEGCTTVVHYL